jgi:hypothetical protein
MNTMLRVITIAFTLLLLAPAASTAAPTDSPKPTPASAQTPVSAAPREKLDEILARPLYQRWHLRQMRVEQKDQKITLMDGIEEELERLIKRFFDWLENLLKNIIPRNAPNIPAASWIDKLMSMAQTLKVVGYVVLAVALLAIAFWLYRAWRSTDRSPRGSKILSREQVRIALDSGQALAMDSQSWLQQAEQLANESDLRAVYRAIYLALLSGLHAAGKIDFRQARTNWTYVNHYRGPGEERETFSSLTKLFDQVWYGHRPAEMVRLAEVRTSVLKLVHDTRLAQPVRPDPSASPNTLSKAGA